LQDYGIETESLGLTEWDHVKESIRQSTVSPGLLDHYHSRAISLGAKALRDVCWAILRHVPESKASPDKKWQLRMKDKEWTAAHMFDREHG